MGYKRDSGAKVDTGRLINRSARVSDYVGAVDFPEVSVADFSRHLNLPKLEALSLTLHPHMRMERKPFGSCVLSLVTFPAGVLQMMPLDGLDNFAAEFRLTVCLSSATLTATGRERPVRRGDLLLIDLAAGVGLSTTRSTTWLTLSIPRAAIASRMGGASQPMSSVPTIDAFVIPRSGNMARLFRGSLLQIWKNNAGLPLIEGAEASEVQLDLLVEVVREAVSGQQDVQSKKLSSLIKVSDAIENNLSDQTLNALSLAARMGLTKSKLIQTLGPNSVGMLIRQHRLLRARRLLRSGASKALTIAEVGRQVGFESLTYFSTIYSETFGLSPLHDDIQYGD